MSDYHHNFMTIIKALGDIYDVIKYDILQQNNDCLSEDFRNLHKSPANILNNTCGAVSLLTKYLTHYIIINTKILNFFCTNLCFGTREHSNILFLIGTETRTEPNLLY